MFRAGVLSISIGLAALLLSSPISAQDRSDPTRIEARAGYVRVNCQSRVHFFDHLRRSRNARSSTRDAPGALSRAQPACWLRPRPKLRKWWAKITSN